LIAIRSRRPRRPWCWTIALLRPGARTGLPSSEAPAGVLRRARRPDAPEACRRACAGGAFSIAQFTAST